MSKSNRSKSENELQHICFTDPTLFRSFKGHKGSVIATAFNKKKYKRLFILLLGSKLFHQVQMAI